MHYGYSPCRRWCCRRDWFSIDHEKKETRSGGLRSRVGCWSSTLATTGAATSTSTSTTASTATDRAGDCDVLFAIQHEGHRWAGISHACIEFQNLFACVGLKRHQSIVDICEDKVACGCECAAGGRLTCSRGTAPNFLLGDGVPRNQEASAPLWTN